MTDLAPAPSRFSTRRSLSPGALGAAIAVHLGVAGIIVALPPALVPIAVMPTFTARNIPMPPEPAVEPPPPAKPDKTRAQSDPLPVASDPFFTGGPVIETQPARFDPPPLPRADPVDPPPLPRVPVKLGAQPDPRFADAFQPAYPPAMLRQGRAGSCTVRVAIDSGGRVIGVASISGSGPAFCAATERQALTRWRFRPATEDGLAVPSEREMTVRFRMTD